MCTANFILQVDCACGSVCRVGGNNREVVVTKNGVPACAAYRSIRQIIEIICIVFGCVYKRSREVDTAVFIRLNGIGVAFQFSECRIRFCRIVIVHVVELSGFFVGNCELTFGCTDTIYNQFAKVYITIGGVVSKVVGVFEILNLVFLLCFLFFSDNFFEVFFIEVVRLFVLITVFYGIACGILINVGYRCRCAYTVNLRVAFIASVFRTEEGVGNVHRVVYNVAVFAVLVLVEHEAACCALNKNGFLAAFDAVGLQHAVVYVQAIDFAVVALYIAVLRGSGCAEVIIRHNVRTVEFRTLEIKTRNNVTVQVLIRRRRCEIYAVAIDIDTGIGVAAYKQQRYNSFRYVVACFKVCLRNTKQRAFGCVTVFVRCRRKSLTIDEINVTVLFNCEATVRNSSVFRRGVAERVFQRIGFRITCHKRENRACHRSRCY